jgi:hypothetical protein
VGAAGAVVRRGYIGILSTWKAANIAHLAKTPDLKFMQSIIIDRL